MGLAWASLAIRKDSRVLPQHEIVDMATCYLFEEELLRSKFTENRIETVAVLTIVDHCCVIFVVVVIFRLRAQTAEYSHFCLRLFFHILLLICMQLIMILIRFKNLSFLLQIPITFVIITWENIFVQIDGDFMNRKGVWFWICALSEVSRRLR